MDIALLNSNIYDFNPCPTDTLWHGGRVGEIVCTSGINSDDMTTTMGISTGLLFIFLIAHLGGFITFCCSIFLH